MFLGRDLIHTRPSYAESTGKAIDACVRQLAIQALNEAIALLEPRREVMDRLVEALIAEETLSSSRFHDLAGLEGPMNRSVLAQRPAAT